MSRLTHFLAACLAYLFVLLAQAAHPSPLLLLGVGASGGGAAAPSITFIACTNSTTDLTTYTFSGADVGTATSGRVTIVGVAGRDSAATYTVDSVTVGGDAATKATDEGAPGLTSTAIYYLANSSGTAEDIVVTFSEGVLSATICVWAADNVNITNGPYSWGNDAQAAGALTLLDHFTTADGVSAAICATPSAATSFTWTGLTERVDAAGEFGWSAADATSSGASSPLVAGCDVAAAVTAGDGSAVHFSGSAVSDPSRTFVACTTNTSNTNIYTYTSHSISTAATNRIVVVGVLGEDLLSTFGVSSMTIGGTSAAEVIDEDGTGTVDSAIYYLAVPTGTTATIVVTYTESVVSSTICVWSLYDVGDLFPSSSATDDDTAGGAIVLTHTTQTKGVSLGVCASDGTVGVSFTWSGLTELVDTSNEFQWSAADLVEDAGTSLAATCDPAGAADTTGSVAHWR